MVEIRDLRGIRSLVEASSEPVPSSGEKDYFQIAKQVMAIMPDLPDDPKEAAKEAAEVFKKLSRSKQILTRAAMFVSRGGKEKQILRKAMKKS